MLCTTMGASGEWQGFGCLRKCCARPLAAGPRATTEKICLPADAPCLCSALLQGAVQALAAAGDMLFSAGQDQSLRVWKLDAPSNQWQCVAVLKVEQGGHRAPISCLWASHPFLFSADYLGTLKVGG